MPMPRRRRRPVVISEIMYHPVPGERLTRTSTSSSSSTTGRTSPFDVGGWKLGGEVTFTIPAGTRIPPTASWCIAKNRSALLVGRQLRPGSGRHAGRLHRASWTTPAGLLVLLNAAGGVVDSVGYDDRFPWPIAADALGASDNWLRPALLPLTAHQYRGISLERVSYDLPSNEVANWVPSTLDGATPGRANTQTGTPAAIVETLTAGTGQRPAAHPVERRGDRPRRAVRPGDARRRATGILRRRPGAHRRGPHHRRHDPQREQLRGPPARPVQQRDRPLPHPGRWGRGLQLLSPRPSDPHDWHAYFVSPAITASQPPYQLFVKATDWGQLWTNVNFSDTNDRRVVPEVHRRHHRALPAPGHLGRARARGVGGPTASVYDVRVRYQGSRWNRPTATRSTSAAPPSAPCPSR
jgi:hypothetical protein